MFTILPMPGLEGRRKERNEEGGDEIKQTTDDR